MDTASRPGRSWLAALLLVLLAICAGALLKSFWSATQPQPDPSAAVSQPDEDQLPPLSVDEALQILADPEAPSLDRAAAMKAVAREGIRTAPPVVKLLDSPSVDVRLSAIALLGQWGPQAEVALPRLRELCADPDPRIGDAAMRALLKVSSNHESLRETLQEAVNRGPEGAASAALDALAQLNPPPLEDLERVAKTAQSPSLKGRALDHLGHMALRDEKLFRSLLKDGILRSRPEMVPALERLVEDEADDELHLGALIQLLGTPRATGSAVAGNARGRQYFAELVAATKRHRDTPRCEELINHLAQSEEKSVPALRALLKSTQHATRSHAASWLAKLTRNAAEVLPVLRESLKTDAPGTDHAVYGLQWLEPQSMAAQPELLELAKSSSPAGFAARRQLKQWGIDVPAPAPVDP